MRADAIGRDALEMGDLPVVVAFCDGVENRPLPIRQRREALGERNLAVDLGADRSSARRDAADGLDE